MSDTAKRGRGRPKGSTSFVKVRLSDLTANLGPNANVAVSKKWLEDIGFELDQPSAPVISSAQEESTPEETIQFVIH